MAEKTTQIDVAEILAVGESVLRSTGATPFGVTSEGFFPKPFARLLAEKLALARLLFGGDIDLTSSSAIRKLVEITALEDARTWSALAAIYDDAFIVTAKGDALSRLGEEQGLPRPFLEARGTVTLRLVGALPSGMSEITLLRGSRMLTSGGHHAALDESATLSPANPALEVAVIAFYPGPEHNLTPNQPGQKLEKWNFEDPQLAQLATAEAALGAPIVAIEHTVALTGGEVRWSDLRYRQLLLDAPRSLWTVDAIRTAVSLVPGVRQVQVHDGLGGLDINQSIFGNFNFIERVFGSERDLGTPYYFTVLVAPTPSAFWDGANGLRVAVESAIEDLRPIGIFPRIEKADEIGVGVRAEILVRGLPLPTGSRTVVNASEPGIALKRRLLQRIRTYTDRLPFGEPVRYAEIIWAILNEPGVADVRDLHLLRYPPNFDTINFGAATGDPQPQALSCGSNIDLQVNQIPVLVDALDELTII